MRKFSLVGRRQLSFAADAPMPEPADDEVLVEVKACTVCGRSDLAYYHYYDLREHCAQGCFGHEIAGVIVEVGRGVRAYRPGERVFIRTPRTTGYAEFAAAREIALGRLPESVPFEQGAILQLLPLAVHATRGVALGDRVLIVGQGPVGLMALQIARLRGAARVVVADLDPWRLAAARRLGADETIVVQAGAEPKLDEAVGGIDVAIDAVGTPRTLNSCVDVVRQNGLVVMLGTHHIDTHVTFDLIQWERKGLRVHTSAEPTDEVRRQAMRQAERLVQAGKIEVASLLTHRMRLEELPIAIEHLSQSAVLKPDDAVPLSVGPPPRTLKVAICT